LHPDYSKNALSIGARNLPHSKIPNN